MNRPRPPARWAVVCAHAVPWLLLLSAFWRLPIAFGHDMGMIDPDAPPWQPWAVPYTLGLIALVEGLGLLTVGLVSEWGERVPRWVPRYGGRPVRPRVVAVAAGLGGTAMTVLWTTDAVAGVRGQHLEFTSTLWWTLAQLALATHVLWGPLLLAVTWDYWRRHQPLRPVTRPAAAGPTAARPGSSAPPAAPGDCRAG